MVFRLMIVVGGDNLDLCKMSIEHPWVSTLGLIAVLMTALVLSLLAEFSVAQPASSDAAAMHQLKGGLKLTDKTDWSNLDPCKWVGVACDSNNRVTRIQVKSQGVSGTLSPSIGNLTNLEVLELMGNTISGPLPSLKGLSSLQTLNLHDNQFSSISADFFDGMTSLQEVYLDNNPFNTWSIPKGLKDAASLKNFSATSANVGGTLPDIFSPDNFPGMIHLHLSYNNLTGGLPSTFSGLGLQSLWLNGQLSNGVRSLNGTIEVLQNMTQLIQIWLNVNAFTGPIPDLSKLTNLAELNLRDNSLTGAVPVSLTKLSSLKTVNLTNNALQGATPKFPASVAADILPDQNCFCLSDPGVDCDSRVNALISVMEPFGYPLQIAQEWKGNDPCSNWMGITCSNKNITIINLKGRGFSGPISPTFSVLTSVQTLILAHNNITGTIPEALTRMPNLRALDVSFNNLYGKVPSFSDTRLNIEGNVNIGKDHPSPSRPTGSPSGEPGTGGKRSNIGVVVGSVIGSVFLISIASMLIFCFLRKNRLYGRVQQSNTVVIRPNHSQSDDGVKITITGPGVNGKTVSEEQSQGSSGPSDVHVIEANNMIISIQVLRNVTNNFSDDKVLGRGGFGTVYKGELPDGTEIAVKRMNSGVLGDKGLAEFKSEIAVLTKVRHRHLVGLLGFCLDGNEKLLVYEYLPQGALSRYLFSWKEEELKPLQWNQRLTIALDVARGVEYLHGLAHQSFIHRDLKPSNILLGDDLHAKVADFGLVRLAPDGGKTSIETRLAGTFGYLAPEYAGKIDLSVFKILV